MYYNRVGYAALMRSAGACAPALPCTGFGIGRATCAMRSKKDSEENQMKKSISGTNGGPLSERGAALLGRESAMPEGGTAMPGRRAAVSEEGVAVSGRGSAIPDRQAVLPGRRAALWAFLAVTLTLLLLLSACGKTEIPEGAVVLEGVYKAEAIPMPDADRILGYPVLAGGDTYAVGWTEDGGRYLAAGSGGRYELKDVGLSAFCPDGEDIFFYGRDGGNSEIFGLLNKGQTVWTVPVSDYMKSPLKNKLSGEMGTLFLLHAKDLWYAVGENDIAVFGGDGSAKAHLTTSGAVRIAFVHGGRVSVVTPKEHLILNGTEQKEGPSWNSVLSKYAVIGGTDEDTALVRSGDSILKVTVSEPAEELLINFTNSGILPSRVQGFVYESDDVVWCLTTGNGLSNMGNAAYKMTRVGTRIIDREHVVNIVYFASGSSYYADAAVLFNMAQDDYFIRLQPYECDTFDEYLLHLDLTVLTNGDCDLVEIRRDPDKYVTKGLFLDLYDGVVSPDEIFTPVKKQYERDGELPVIPLSFGIWGMMTDGSITDGGADWTVERFIEASREKAPIKGMTSGAMSLRLYGMDEAIFTSFMKDTFDRQAFVDFAGFYTSAIPGGDEEGGYPLDYLEVTGRFAWNRAKILHEDPGWSMIGFPTAEGGRFRVSGYENLGILKTAPSAAGAKLFLRFLLSCETLRDVGGLVTAIPAMKEAVSLLREMDRGAYIGYWVPTGTTKLITVNTENPRVVGYEDGRFVADDDALFESYLSFIESAEPLKPIPKEITDILREGLTELDGGRPAAEIAGILESRINLYLQEHS